MILTYDVSEKKVAAVNKLLKKYLTWTQNSVFEGELSKGVLKKCLTEVRRMINKNEDSIYVYTVEIADHIKKEVIGIHKNYDDIII
ncbi:MAG: CRISPR-associated protein Cas2 [Clostridiales bacterium]|nr:CRISPR-associated protein Cas2 [Clostridiales bacterium]